MLICLTDQRQDSNNQNMQDFFMLVRGLNLALSCLYLELKDELGVYAVTQY